MSKSKSDRNLEIIKARRNGETFAEIGRCFGLSSSRVQQIVRRNERNEREAKRYSGLAGLSHRTRNCLLRWMHNNELFNEKDFYDREVLANKLRNVKRNDLLKVRNLGVKSIDEIERFTGVTLN